EVSQRDDRLVLSIPGQPALPLVHVTGRRYKLASPAPDGFFITFRPAASDPKATEALLEQPQGNVVLVKQAGEKYAGAMTVEELMKKEVDALGGEAALRKHTSLMLKTRQALEDQGIVADSTEWFERPARHAELQTLFAAGKRIATSHDYCDGKQAGGENT